MAYWKSLYPDTTTQASPETSWGVWQKELSSYLQADFNGDLGSMRYSGNVGVRLIHTNLDITQYKTGLPGENITEPAERRYPGVTYAATTTSCRRSTSR